LVSISYPRRRGLPGSIWPSLDAEAEAIADTLWRLADAVAEAVPQIGGILAAEDLPKVLLGSERQ
jgi:hypothetical protein